MKKYVLVIDDEADFTFLLKKNLEAAGDFDVTVCNDASKAVERARQLRPSLILLDIMMPAVGGEEIAVELKRQKDTKDIPVVFLTSLVREEEAAEGSHVIGGQMFVAKPVKIQELIAVIEKVTSGPPAR